MSELLDKEDYAILAVLSIDIEPKLEGILNRNGATNWTVCPVCNFDDFQHAEGCEMIQMVAEQE